MAFTDSHLTSIHYKNHYTALPTHRLPAEHHSEYVGQFSPTSFGYDYQMQPQAYAPHAIQSPVDELYTTAIYHRSHPSTTSSQAWVPSHQNSFFDYASGIPTSYSPHFPTTSLQHDQQTSHPIPNTGRLELYANAQRPTLAGSLDPATGVFYRTPEHPRLRTAQACEKCRTRKAKCSGEHPSCKRCINRGLICEYAKEGRVRGPNKPKPKAVSGADSSSAPASQSQSAAGAVLSSSNSSMPSRRYVSPSILPPSMSASLSPSSSVGSYDSLSSPITSNGSTSDCLSEAPGPPVMKSSEPTSGAYETEVDSRISYYSKLGMESMHHSTLPESSHIPLAGPYHLVDSPHISPTLDRHEHEWNSPTLIDPSPVVPDINPSLSRYSSAVLSGDNYSQLHPRSHDTISYLEGSRHTTDMHHHPRSYPVQFPSQLQGEVKLSYPVQPC